MCREKDDPEVLWTNEMRTTLLLPAVHTHLGDFPRQLQDHVTAIYDYTPMPPMAYPQLSGELWCHRYYLRTLCSPAFRDTHPLVEHVDFLKALLAEWRSEMARTASLFSKSDALTAMGLEPATLENKPLDEAVEILKRAYRTLARQLHPDKNPAGGPAFVAMQAAYDGLLGMAAGEAAETGGPRAARVLLLLNAQSLLYRREPDMLATYKYAGYGLLVQVLQGGVKCEGGLEDGLKGELIQAAVELAWLTCSSGPLNAQELARGGGVVVLTELLSRCCDLARIGGDLAMHSRPATIVTLVLRTLACTSGFEDGRDAAESVGGRTVTDVLEMTRCITALAPAAAALDVVAALSASPTMQDSLLRRGALTCLLPRILEYVYRAVLLFKPI